MSNAKISVIVPAYNSEKTIQNTISSILNQPIKEVIDLIVVDDGSTDKTAKIVRQFSNVKYIYQKNSGPASARNRGAQEADGDLLFFTDSDCIPHQDWILKMLPHFAEPKVGVVAGSYGISNQNSWLARCIHTEIIYRHHQLLPRYPKVFGSYNFGIKRKIFELVGGFNTDYRFASGEDNDLSYKILKAGYQIYFEKESVVDHFHTEQFNKYLFEQFRHGYWRTKMYFDHPHMGWGDDYTFWKDIIEIPLAIFSIICLILGLWFGSPILKLAFFLSFLLFMLEFIYGFIIGKSFLKICQLTFMMFLRSLVRSFGFLLGFFTFLPRKIFFKIITPGSF